MIDALTKQPIKVLWDERAGGWLHLPADQVDVVVKLLQERGVRCWRAEHVMSFNGGPAMGYVHLSRNEKAETAQAVLDSVP